MLSKTYEEYDIVDPDEINEEGGNGEDEGEGEDPYEGERRNSEEEAARKSLKPGLFHEENLAEHVDEIEGIENKEFAKLKKKI